MTEPIEVMITLPGRDAPGFLRRIRKLTEIIEGSKGALDMWSRIADHLVGEGYVSAPEGVDVREAIADMSQRDIQTIVAALLGESTDKEPGKGAGREVNPQSAG